MYPMVKKMEKTIISLRSSVSIIAELDAKAKLVLAYAFLSRMYVHLPFMALIFSNKGLGAVDAGYLFSMYALANMFFEIPTGVFAARFGSKVSILIGRLLIVVGLAALYFGSSFNFLLLAQLLIALGESFSSGADVAIYYKSVNGIGIRDDSRISKLWNATCWSAVLIAFMLGGVLSYSIDLVLIASILLSITSCFVAFGLEYDDPKLNTSRSFNFNAISRLSMISILKSASCLGFIMAGYSVMQLAMVERGIGGFEVSIIFSVGTVVAIFSSLNYRESRELSDCSLLIVLFVISITLVCVFINVNSFFMMVLLFCLYRYIWGQSGVLCMKIVNNTIEDSNVRPVVLSIESVVRNAFQALFVYIITSILLT